MGIEMSKDLTNSSRLDDRISADLRARAQSSRRDDVDYAEDAAYVKDTKKTGRFTWVWIILIILAIISLVCIAFI